MKTKLLIWCCGVLVAAGACEVTSEKIDRWKRSTKGAAKIRAAVRDTDQKLDIRVEAASALAEMGLFLPLQEDIKSLQPKDRTTVMEALIPALVTKMEGSTPKSTSRVQIQAKDALFSLRELCGAALRETVDKKVVRWLLADWRKRSSGEHSAEKIIGKVGETAGPLLVEGLGKGGMPLVATATLVGQVGPQSARDAAAARLVSLAAETKPADVKVFHALGKVGSPRAVEYLEQVAVKGSDQERLWALRALALSPSPALVDTMKAIAGDTSLAGERAILRDEAFTVLEKISDPRSLEALLGFLEAKDERVRYRVVEAVLAGFGAQGLAKLLEELPSRYTYRKVDLVDFVEKDIRSLKKSALPVLRNALDSKSWVARLIAVRMLGQMGTEQDVKHLKKLTDDSTRLRGWEGDATIGSEAKAAIKAIEDRK